MASFDVPNASLAYDRQPGGNELLNTSFIQGMEEDCRIACDAKMVMGATQ